MHKIKIVAIGGGTGLATLLRGIKKFDDIDITAVVSMMDDGGSSGRLREEFGVVSPGDIRNCLLALSTQEDVLTKLFHYRFPVRKEQPEVGGHSLGNLLLIAMSEIYGGFDKSVQKISEILNIKGKVIPVTLESAQLVAELSNGKVIEGESKISKSNVPIAKLRIKPGKIKYHPEVVKSILNADLIVIGPGSLFTSIIPNIIVKDITDSISKSKAKKVYICNIMTQPGETDGYTVTDHIIKIYDHCQNKFKFDYVIVNSGKLTKKMLKKYSKENSFPVKIDYDKIKEYNLKLIETNLVSPSTQKYSGKYVRHDHTKLARVVLSLTSFC